MMADFDADAFTDGKNTINSMLNNAGGIATLYFATWYNHHSQLWLLLQQKKGALTSGAPHFTEDNSTAEKFTWCMTLLTKRNSWWASPIKPIVCSILRLIKRTRKQILQVHTLSLFVHDLDRHQL